MQSNEPEICIDLGCGMKKMISNTAEKWVGFDIRKFDGVDYVLNVGKDIFPAKTNSVKSIRAIHLFEHLYSDELFHWIEECWRVLKPTGTLFIEVPKAGTKAYYIHPDHKIQFVEDSFGFFQVPSEGKDPHGYLHGFWHVSVKESGNPETIKVEMYPNKPDGRFPYKEIVQQND